MDAQNIFAHLRQSIFSTDYETIRQDAIDRRKKEGANLRAQDYLETSLAANLPSYPISDAFQQANNYKDIIYLAIQHLMQAMSGVSAGLERKVKDSGKAKIAQSGAQNTDQGYEPFFDHPLCDIINRPNPADTFIDFTLQCILNWNLHGVVRVWGRPNNVGAPVRFYCLPIPLLVPAFSVGASQYPLGAWRLQHYYPATGITGYLPMGLSQYGGALIDSREIYEMKNPHPVYRWAPYSHLFGSATSVDVKQMIDTSFWSIYSQGPKPTGIIDLPGADGPTIEAIQNKIDNNHGGAFKHGKPIVLGGGDVERPAIKWTPFSGLAGGDAFHGEGWEIYTSFVLAIFGLDMASVGLRRTGGYAERWAVRRDERETLVMFLSRLAAMLTNGGLVKYWGLLKKNVRVMIHLPEVVGYEPSEMSKDLAGDGSGTLDEVRYLRGLKKAEKYGNLPVAIANKMIEKDLGLDQQEQPPDPNAPPLPGSTPPQKTNEENKGNKPEENRPDTPEKAKGALGGEGSGGDKQPRIAKALIDNVMRSSILVEPSTNGKHHD